MKLPVLALVACLLAAAPAAASGVDVLVVGKTETLREQRGVPLRTTTVKAGGRRCRVAGGTALAVLARTRLALRIRDYGSCSKDTGDAAGLYVTGVAGNRASGRNGWVYKVGNRARSRGAGDRGLKLRAGRRVTWFWCVSGTGGCQRTLVATPAARTAAPGTALEVTVRGYDDGGKAVLVQGATVRLAGATAVTGADGVAVLTVPAAPGRQALVAERAGMVRSFSEQVTIG
jgi:hypothetical protein